MTKQYDCTSSTSFTSENLCLYNQDKADLGFICPSILQMFAESTSIVPENSLI